MPGAAVEDGGFGLAAENNTTITSRGKVIVGHSILWWQSCC
jgi:hypothetical protein